MVFVEFQRAFDGRMEYFVGVDVNSILNITENGVRYARVRYVDTPDNPKMVSIATVGAKKLNLFKSGVDAVGNGQKQAEWLGTAR